MVLRVALLFCVATLVLCRHGEVPKDAFPATAARITDAVQFTVSINGEEQQQKIVIGLFGKDVPKTTENFRKICEGYQEKYGPLLHYNGSPFHRIIPGFVIQGGDVVRHDGTDNQSIFGGNFKDESFMIKHSEGCLGMANTGKDTNGSQFYITLDSADHLNGRHVVFGRVLRGMDLVRKISGFGKNNGKPLAKVTIEACDPTNIPKLETN